MEYALAHTPIHHLTISSYLIIAHVLPEPTFVKLISQPNKLRQDMLGPDAEIFDAQLRYNPSPTAFLGIGSFKTTTRAQLTFKGIYLPVSGLGIQNQAEWARGARWRNG